MYGTVFKIEYVQYKSSIIFIGPKGLISGHDQCRFRDFIDKSCRRTENELGVLGNLFIH